MSTKSIELIASLPIGAQIEAVDSLHGVPAGAVGEIIKIECFPYRAISWGNEGVLTNPFIRTRVRLVSPLIQLARQAR